MTERHPTRIEWTTQRRVSCGPISIACAEDVEIVTDSRAGWHQSCGIRPNTPRQRLIKGLVWPIDRLFDYLLVTGYLERGLGRWLRRYGSPNSVILDVGAGAMGMARYVPKGAFYNVLDIAYSEFALRRALKPGADVNAVIASATNMPIASNSVDIVLTKEALMYIPEIGRALKEIHRVLRPGGKFLCTLGNVNTYKYARKGQSHDFANSFSFQEFRNFAAEQGFRCLECYQRGYWIPLPLWLTKATLNLPLTSKNEYYNTNFLYLFEAVK